MAGQLQCSADSVSNHQYGNLESKVKSCDCASNYLEIEITGRVQQAGPPDNIAVVFRYQCLSVDPYQCTSQV